MNLNGIMQSPICSPVFTNIPNTPVSPSIYNSRMDDLLSNSPWGREDLSPRYAKTFYSHGPFRAQLTRHATAVTDVRRTPLSQTTSANPAPSTPRPVSQQSSNHTEINEAYINSLYNQRNALKNNLERLSIELLYLLYEEWSLTGIVPEEFEKFTDRTGRPSHRMKSTSYPMRHFMVQRANTFSYSHVPSPVKQNSILSNQSPTASLFEYPKKRITQTSPKSSFSSEIEDGFNELHLGIEATACPVDNRSSTENNIPNKSESPPGEVYRLVDDMDVQLAAVELRLRRLEVDFAVVSHLREIHKKKAAETKIDAYKIAYKTNSKKLKEILSEMSYLKTKINIANGKPDVSHQSLTNLSVLPTGRHHVMSPDCSSLPSTPLKFRFTNRNILPPHNPSTGPSSFLDSDRKSIGFAKPQGRGSLRPIFKMFNSQSRRSVRPEKLKILQSTGVVPRSDLGGCTVKDLRTNERKILHGSCNTASNVSTPIDYKPLQLPPNVENNQEKSARVAIVDPDVFVKHRSGIQRSTYHRIKRSNSLPDSRHSDQPAILVWKPPATKSATDFKHPSQACSPNQRLRLCGYRCRCNHFFPKQIVPTASTTSSSNWSTSGCSGLSSNTGDSISPSHSSNVRRSTSTPALSSRVSLDSSSACTSGSIAAVTHLPNVHDKLSDNICSANAHKDASFEKDILNACSDDEGYVRLSDCETASDALVNGPIEPCESTLVESRSTSQSPSRFQYHPQVNELKACTKRPSLKPFALIRRAVSRMSSRGRTHRNSPSTTTSHLKEKARYSIALPSRCK